MAASGWPVSCRSPKRHVATATVQVRSFGNSSRILPTKCSACSTHASERPQTAWTGSLTREAAHIRRLSLDPTCRSIREARIDRRVTIRVSSPLRDTRTSSQTRGPELVADRCRPHGFETVLCLQVPESSKDSTTPASRLQTDNNYLDCNDIQYSL
jgi:hypothetical protein